jgi:exonuclease SbcD
VALGHLHRQQAAGGCETVRYAGSPIPLSFSEAGDTKTVQVLDFVAGQLAGRLALPVPQARLLVRLSATRDTLASVLGQFEPPPAPLPAWVELEIEDPVAGEDLYGRTQDLARGKGFEVIRVIGKGLAVLSGMSAGDAPDADRIGNLLADPARVFDLRLDAEPGLTDAERESLRTAFRELLDLHAEQPAAARGSPGSGVPAPIEP